MEAVASLVKQILHSGHIWSLYYLRDSDSTSIKETFHQVSEGHDHFIYNYDRQHYCIVFSAYWEDKQYRN